MATRMTSKSDLEEQIYKLERRLRDLEDTLVYAGVFSYDERAVYTTQWGRVLINKVKVQ
jgi:hypothetical protein